PAAREAGRDPDALDVSGNLLSVIDETRRDALNRAKRDPFVIYMMSILSDVTLRRAGFDPENRDRIAAKWRAEDYTGAGALIADELLDAYILCGTRREVAERARAYHEAGMALPLLQPVVQEEAQVQALLEAAVLYGSAEVGSAARVALAEQRKTLAQRTRDQLGALWEIARPFSFTASTVPVAAGGALAAVAGAFDPGLFVAALVGAVALHVGTNVTNTIYDVRKGVDTIVSPRASHAIVKGRISDSDAYRFAIAAFAIALLMGIVLTLVRGLPIVVLGIIGLIGGYTYTAPPFQYKFGPIGIPIV